jgi:hypothetical protein
MRWIILVFALLAGSVGTAQANPMLDRVKDWLSTRVEGCGRACTIPGIRPADNILDVLKQNRTGWINSGDARVIDSRRFAPEHGIRTLNWALKDAQDEGSTRLQVFNYEGDKIFDKMYAFKGDHWNGRVVRGSLDARDFGKSGWRGLSARLTMIGDGEGFDRNGVSFTFNYRADPTCQFSRPAPAHAAAMSAPNRKEDAYASKVDRQREGARNGRGKHASADRRRSERRDTRAEARSDRRESKRAK